MGKRKLVIIGLDGGTYKIIDPLIEQGKLPYIEGLIKRGTRGVLMSTIPPLTPAAWVTFMTGKNPGKHGFFDFRRYDIKEYDYYYIPRPRDAVRKRKFVKEGTFQDSHYFAGQTLWDFLSKVGYRVCVIMFPLTFPPWPVNGYMVSGFPSPNFKNPSTYPEDWKKEIGPLFDISAITFNNEDNLIAECKNLIKKETAVLLDQIKNNNSDVFSMVFSSTDFAQHHLWKYLKDNHGPYSNAIQEIYEAVDAAIGQILSFVDEDTSIVILSDHGFCSCPKKYFNTNAWLKEEGYLSLRERNLFTRFTDPFLDYLRYKKAGLKKIVKGFISKFPLAIRQRASSIYLKTGRIEWSKTNAFRYKMGPCEGIVINQKGRQKLGAVNEGEEYEELRDEIIKKLLGLRDPYSGRKIVRKAFKREDLYAGEFLNTIPDIVLLLNPNFIGGLEIDRSIVEPVREEFKESFSGAHDMDGIFILSGPKFRKGATIDSVDMVDVTPTILFDLGLPIPQDMDGKVILEAFREPFNSEPVQYTQPIQVKKQGGQKLSQKEQEEIEKTLRGLGYLG